MKVDFVKTPIALDQVVEPIVRDGIAYWKSLCRGRLFPARADVAPSGMKKLLPNAVLTRVIDGGKDYEYRIAGQAHTSVHRLPLQGSLLTALSLPPDYLSFLKSLYDETLKTRGPYAVKGAVRSGDDYPTHFQWKAPSCRSGPTRRRSTTCSFSPSTGRNACDKRALYFTSFLV